MPFDNNTTAGEAANAFSGEIKGKNIIVTGVSPVSSPRLPHVTVLRV